MTELQQIEYNKYFKEVSDMMLKDDYLIDRDGQKYNFIDYSEDKDRLEANYPLNWIGINFYFLNIPIDKNNKITIIKDKVSNLELYYLNKEPINIDFKYFLGIGKNYSSILSKLKEESVLWIIQDFWSVDDDPLDTKYERFREWFKYRYLDYSNLMNYRNETLKNINKLWIIETNWKKFNIKLLKKDVLNNIINKETINRFNSNLLNMFKDN